MIAALCDCHATSRMQDWHRKLGEAALTTERGNCEWQWEGYRYLDARDGLDDGRLAVGDVTDGADVNGGLTRDDLRREGRQLGDVESGKVLLRQMRSVELVLALDRERCDRLVRLLMKKMEGIL